jgi:hypothetical protein
VGYLQIVFAAVWGAAFFAAWPDAWSVVGTLVILASTLFLASTRRRSAPGLPGSGPGARAAGGGRSATSADPADAGAA